MRIDADERSGYASVGGRGDDWLRMQRRAPFARHDFAAFSFEPRDGDRQSLDREARTVELGRQPMAAGGVARTARLLVAEADIGREVGGDRIRRGRCVNMHRRRDRQRRRPGQKAAPRGFRHLGSPASIRSIARCPCLIFTRV